jgi:hypothetical protein
MTGGEGPQFDSGEPCPMIVRIMVSSLLFVVYLSALSAIAPAAAAESYRWRWEKIPGPGEHPWITSWRSNQTGRFCDHTGGREVLRLQQHFCLWTIRQRPTDYDSTIRMRQAGPMAPSMQGRMSQGEYHPGHGALWCRDVTAVRRNWRVRSALPSIAAVPLQCAN